MKRTEIITKYDAYDQPTEKATFEKTTSEKGLVSREAQFDSAGNLVLEVNYHYEADNLVRIDQIAGGMTQMVKHMDYNAEGVKIKETWLAFDDIKMYEMNRDPAQLELNIKEYNMEGGLLVERLDTLDKDGNLIKEIIDGDYIVESTYENGNLVKSEISDAGEKIQSEEYHFDENNIEIGCTITDHSSGEQTIIKAELDDANNKTKEYFFQKDKLIFDKSFAYDDKNRITMVEARSPQGKEVKEYSYSE